MPTLKNNMPKIVHLTSVHTPFDIRIFQKECKSLANAGYDVSLVVPHTQDESKDGIQIIAVPKSKNRLERIVLTSWRVFRGALEQRATVYHFHDFELMLVGLVLKLLGKKVIYDVHEDLPRQVLSKPWIPAVLRKLVSFVVERLESVLASIIDGIVTVTPTIAKRFPKEKTVLVQNFPIEEELVLAESKPYQGRSYIAYVGGMAVIRGIHEMVAAMGLLPKDVTATLVLAGAFRPASLEEDMKKLPGWARVEARGFQSRKQVAQLLSESAAGLVLFHPEPNHINAQPNKLFEYMSAGVPIIASDFPLWRDIVEGVNCGLLVDPMNPQAIADATTWLLSHPDEAEAMGKRGQAAVTEKYNWAQEEVKLIAFYRRVLQS
jgi:glycosyltransferase involved in cell wall biosynthesis